MFQKIPVNPRYVSREKGSKTETILRRGANMSIQEECLWSQALGTGIGASKECGSGTNLECKFPVCSISVPSLFHLRSYSHIVPITFHSCDTLFLSCSSLKSWTNLECKIKYTLFQDCARWKWSKRTKRASGTKFQVCSVFVPIPNFFYQLII